MISKDISNSKKFAKLSPESAVLFCMIIPHLNSYGKINGDPGYLKAEICPRILYLDYKKISKCLQEITENTNMKWFQHDGRHWIHAINFLSEHQFLKPERLGEDKLPSYSGVIQELVPPEYKDKDKDKGNSGVVPEDIAKEIKTPKLRMEESFTFFWNKYPKKVSKADAEKAWNKINPNNGTYQKIMIALDKFKKSEQWIQKKGTFIPYPATWLRDKRWEDEFLINDKQPKLPNLSKDKLEKISSMNLDAFTEEKNDAASN
jgi:hypothetical protein